MLDSAGLDLVLASAMRSLATDERVVMPRQMLRNIRAHAMEYVPQEVCGMIGGDGEQAVMLARCPNRSPTPETHFAILQFDQFRVEHSFEEKQVKLIGIYHSHVKTGNTPSAADLTNIPSQLLSVIYSIVDDEIRVWRGNKAVSLEVR